MIVFETGSNLDSINDGTQVCNDHSDKNKC